MNRSVSCGRVLVDADAEASSSRYSRIVASASLAMVDVIEALVNGRYRFGSARYAR